MHRDVESWAQMLWIEMPQRVMRDAEQLKPLRASARPSATPLILEATLLLIFGLRDEVGRRSTIIAMRPKSALCPLNATGARHPHRHRTG
ncbi:hypothetical protein KTE91_12865 [Burkholderia multivorans]|uniref:hypothetical protein n=1 Tax=Burkholderia multivorans TaxID=87883 RepID=UPI001C227306|nr:hypothetical protein [Burkholderia multivorans]MBU9435991.1 hypothetical protein [Burkholderia multivorans]